MNSTLQTIQKDYSYERMNLHLYYKNNAIHPKNAMIPTQRSSVKLTACNLLDLP